MSAATKWIWGCVAVTALVGGLHFTLSLSGTDRSNATENTGNEITEDPPRGNQLRPAWRAFNKKTKDSEPTKKYLPRQWRDLPPDEATNKLIELWLFTTRETDPTKRAARLKAVNQAVRSRGASAVPLLQTALGRVEQYDQRGRTALLYSLGELAHELTSNADSATTEAVDQIVAIVEQELAQPDSIPVGEFLSDWPRKALDQLMHHDSRFTEEGGEIHLSTDYAKMSAVQVYRRIGDQRAVDRLRTIEQDKAFSDSVRRMATVTLATLSR